MRLPGRQQVVGEGEAEGGVTLFPALVEVWLFCVSTGDPCAGPLCDVRLLPLAREEGLPLAQGDTAERPVGDAPELRADGEEPALCADPFAPVASGEAGISACDMLAAKKAVAANAAATIPVLMRNSDLREGPSAGLTSAVVFGCREGGSRIWQRRW